MMGCYVYPHCLQDVPADVQVNLAMNLWRRSAGLMADEEFYRLPPSERAGWYFQAGRCLPRIEALQ